MFCCYYPELRSATSKRVIDQATVCTNCGSFYHRGCIKRCNVNSDGSVFECCEPFPNDDDADNLDDDDDDINTRARYVSSASTKHYTDDLMQSDVSNLQFRDIIVRKLDRMSSHLDNINKRISKNERDIFSTKQTIIKINNKLSSKPTELLSDLMFTVFLEQDDRAKSQTIPSYTTCLNTT